MTKLSCVLAIAAMFGLAGCPKKNDDKNTDQARKTTDVATPTPTTDDKTKPDPVKPDPAKPDEVKPDPAKPDDKAATPAAGALPAECTAYKDAMAKATACEKLGAQRDELKRQFESSSAAWDKLDEAGRTQLAETCKKLAATVTSVTAAACP